jgi:3,4-dihydroxy 2-butanone 4-phosphate synthase/GTP cyclohydrolase II
MISSIADIIKDVAQGQMVILVDDESRENEGDLFIPAASITPEAINFMAMHGRGLICMPVAPVLADALDLPPMVQDNQASHKTAFTVSIGARAGITTGISAHDRALTIQTAIKKNAKAEDLVRPGHVFPLRACENGVLERAGHTEAAVDLARLAGFAPAGVICEIMKDDGTMARMADLIIFAAHHGLKIGTIADLIAYRRNPEKSKVA